MCVTVYVVHHLITFVPTGITVWCTHCAMNARHSQQYSMLSKSAESFSAWVVTVQLLHLAAILRGGTTCQPASLVESKIYVIWHAYIIRI